MSRRTWSLIGLLSLACVGSSAAVTPSGDAPGAPPTASATAPEAALPAWLRARLPSMRLSSAKNAVALGPGPHITVDASHVVVDGVEVANVSHIEALGRPQRVDGVFRAMTALRLRAQAEHPSVPYHGRVTYWIDNRVSAVVVKSVFQTAAFAGSPYGYFAVRRPDGSGFARLAALARVPGPPSTAKQASATTTVSGRLPPETIQRIVRANYAQFRSCYEDGLARNSTLSGRVTIRFVIDRDGFVLNPQSIESTVPDALPDAAVVKCVVEGFKTLVFPPPEGGIVTVVYPIMLEPG
jgi:hypothetical protein